MRIGRRNFIKASAASAFLSKALLTQAQSAQVAVQNTEDSVVVTAREYVWRWSPRTDVFRVEDKRGLPITEGPMQPAILVRDARHESPWSGQGKVQSKSFQNNRLTVTYSGVNNASRVTMAWRFDDEGFWLEPIQYDAAAEEDVVSVLYFAERTNDTVIPGLRFLYLIQPGLNNTCSVSPVLSKESGEDLTTWLGHGGGNLSTLQEWALPSHYFCLCSSDLSYGMNTSIREHLSHAVCFGLADMPAGDMLFRVAGHGCSPLLGVHSDLWGNARGPASLKLGPTFYCAIGENYYSAIRGYYLGLVRAGIIKIKRNSKAKNALVTASAYDTWGAQIGAEKLSAKLDQPFCEQIYQDMKASGMKFETFVIDDKWEGTYGSLTHSKDRFPQFEEFLDRVRSDGYKVGMWAAFLRCEKPEALGLGLEHMIRGRDGKPVALDEGGNPPYYIFDVTQPEVAQVVTKHAQEFMRRYKPDWVKFDFGYELPPLSDGAPRDLNWAGERLFYKAVQLVVDALRSVNPDVVVMYYSLSPLFIDYLDLHSADDMYACGDGYELEANRRLFFSSLLGEIGMPTYGSSGYDWWSVRDIWFDSVVTGNIGSLTSFQGNEKGSKPAPEIVAKCNGLVAIARRTNVFHVEPLSPVLAGGVIGAHSSSWARHENGDVVLVALRENDLIGSGKGPGQYRDLVRSNSSVVVASMDSNAIGMSKKIGIVPYGDGALSIRQARGKTARIKTHLLGHDAVESSVNVEDGQITLPLSERMANGALVSWVEVEIS